MTGRLKVIFIGGCSRSGSTLLGLLLDQVEGFFHVGEFHQVWKRSFQQDWQCECGRPFRQCPVWQNVVRRAFGGFDEVDTEGMRRLRRIAMRPRLTERPQQANANAEYAGVLERFLRATAEVTGARVIVDTSKNADHGRVLASAPGLDVRVLHVVRDARAVAHSMARQRSMPGPTSGPVSMARMSPLAAAMHWRRENARTARLAEQLPHSVTLAYERLAAEPETVMPELLARLGEDDASLPFLHGAKADVLAGHSLAGNPMRHADGEIHIRLDDEWRRTMPAWRRLLVTALTARSMRLLALRRYDRR